MTLGAEVSLPLHVDASVSYAQIEDALLGAGFTEYTIMRTVTSESTDAQVFVRNPVVNGEQDALVAVETLQALTDALTALDAEVPAPSA